MLDKATIAQLQFLTPSTSAQYAKFCKSRFIAPNTDYYETFDGNKIAGHWLGSPDAEKVVLYLHGGGYTQPANEGNFQHAGRLMEDMKGTRGLSSVSTLLIEYTLVPEATYPTQLKEASAVLAQLLTRRKPSDIIISGDSAGGNLVLALLSHLLHPHPEVPVIKIETALCGALIYSPWTGFSTDYPSFANVNLDMLSPLALRKWTAMFLGKANPSNPEADPGLVIGDAYTETSKNPASWWKGMHAICEEIFVCYGGDEVLADSIEEFGSSLKIGWNSGGGDPGRLVFFRAAREAHVAPIVDTMTPNKLAKSSTQNGIEEWYRARLSIQGGN